MRAVLALYEHAAGVTTGSGTRVVYDLAEDVAHFGAATVAGPALCWELGVLADDDVYEMRHYEDDLGLLRWELVPIGGDSPVMGNEVHGDAGGEVAGSAALAVAVELDETDDWLVRCDRVDFPPGAVAYRHTHPGPGIRRLLFGELTVTTGGLTTAHRAGGAWFESGPEPVYAESSATEETAFVRVMLLPVEWAGKRTIRYTDPADADRPARQRARVFLEEPLA